MGKPRECAQLILKGETPSEIAHQMGVTFNTVTGHIYRAIGEGFITRSDALLNIHARLVDFAAQHQIQHDGTHLPQKAMLKATYATSLRHDCRWYYQQDPDRTLSADLYCLLATFESDLHNQVYLVLHDLFGDADESWWSKGVPQYVRDACNRCREADDAPAHPFSYTTFGHLARIIDANWEAFVSFVPPALSPEPQLLFEALRNLRLVRNRVMHPVRDRHPARTDFDTVRSWLQALAPSRWSTKSVEAPPEPA